MSETEIENKPMSLKQKIALAVMIGGALFLVIAFTLILGRIEIP